VDNGDPSFSCSRVSVVNDDALRMLARRQYGLLTRTQLLEAGVGRGFVQSRAGREWPALMPGVYQCCPSTDELRQRTMAAVLRWPDSQISHVTAGRLRGWEEPMTQPRWRDLGPAAAPYVDDWPDDRVHLTTAVRHPRSSASHICHRGDPGELAFVGGIPCSDSIATAMQIAGTTPLAYSVPLLDRLAEQEPEFVWELRAAIDKRRGMPGVARARRAVSLVDGFSQSILESLARLLLRLGGLPTPRLQVEVITDTGKKRGDLGYDDCDLIIELDGRKGHERWVDVVKDLPRQNAITNAGRRVLRFGWYDVLFQPERYLSTIRTARALATNGPKFTPDRHL
jgi:very-short-patch-repair endonuclease